MAHGYWTQGARLFLCGLLMLALGLAPGGPAAAQQAMPPEFEVDIVNVRERTDPALTRVDLYTKISYDRLQFINTADGFTARYEVAAAFYGVDEKGRPQDLVQTRSWERSVTAGAFGATQSRDFFDSATQSLALAPGRYLLEVQVTDLETEQAASRRLPVAVRDLDKPVAVSDLILIDAFDARESSITPRVESHVSSDVGELTFFYELYAERATRVRVTREVVHTGKGGAIPTMRSIFGLDRGEDLGEILYTQEEALPLKPGRTQTVMNIPIRDLKAGEYLVRLVVESEGGRLLDHAEKTVVVEWTGLAEHLRDLDQAIAQLQYIAKDKDLRYIRDGRTEGERLHRFREFWEKRDPTPGTDRNERMEEYYYRIASANQKYGGLAGRLAQGWKTDQGHVLVLFGEPERIERQGSGAQPHEVWYYNRIGRRFIFVDEGGSFRLLVPIWDERTRIR